MLTQAGTDLQQNRHRWRREVPEHQPRLLSAMPVSLGWALGSMAPKGAGGQLGISARMAGGKWKGKNRDTKASTT